MKDKAALVALAAALVAVCVAWPASATIRPAAATANSAGFSDATGDSGNAPDITAVNVSNDDAGVITFAITIPNRTALGPQDAIDVVMDTDTNPNDGHNGWDYAAFVTPAGPVVANGTSGTFSPQFGTSIRASFANGVETISVNKADIGNPSLIVFFAESSGDLGSSIGDDAPDGNTVWLYAVTVAAPAPPASTSSATAPSSTSPAAPAAPLTLSATKLRVGKARAGMPFAVSMVVQRDDTGELLDSGQIACSARIQNSALPVLKKSGPLSGVAVCTWQLPKKAHGKLLQGSITVVFKGKKVTRPFSVHVT